MLFEHPGDGLIHVLLQFCAVEIKTALGKDKTAWDRLRNGGYEGV